MTYHVMLLTETNIIELLEKDWKLIAILSGPHRNFHNDPEPSKQLYRLIMASPN